MRIAVTGATGMIGTAVVAALRDRGDHVIVLSRDPRHARRLLGDLEMHAWPDPTHTPPPLDALAGADAVVHLLGEPIAQRWTDAVKREIDESRSLATRMLVEGMAAVPSRGRPGVLVSQSATGYYGACDAEWLDEDAPAGNDFLAQVVVAWEREALRAAGAFRVAVTRTGVVLSPDGGALGKMLPPFRVGAGGPVAGGRQYVPWVHLDDVVGGLLHCVDTAGARGAINLVAPNPVTNAELSRALGRALHRPAAMPIPAAALRVLYGQMTVIVTASQRVSARRLLGLGYSFRHTNIATALHDVLQQRAA